MPQLGYRLEADEILPGLWQGSFPYLGSAAEAGFGAVVRCAEEKLKAREYTESIEFGMRIIDAPFTDTPWPRPDELAIAVRAAHRVAMFVGDGLKVLVTCYAGLNRSGLVTALAICELMGCTGLEAIEVVRDARPAALHNNSFVSVIHNRFKRPA